MKFTANRDGIVKLANMAEFSLACHYRWAAEAKDAAAHGWRLSARLLGSWARQELAEYLKLKGAT